MKLGGKKALNYALSIASLVALVVAMLPSQQAMAAELSQRKLTLVAGTTDQGSKPGGVVKHQFDFTTATTGNIGSIKFQYCTVAQGSCTMPTGLVTTSASLDFENGATGFSVVNTTNGSPYLTRSAANVNSSVALTYRLANITNPTATNQSFYVRISTYASTDTTGSATDTGVVAASTATQITLTGTMPESLIFCTGGTINAPGGIPDCSSAGSGAVSFNQLFSTTDTATATSQMAASTNAINGYVITVRGTTLTNGSYTIPAMSTQAAGTKGTGQFGMNLKANTTTTSNPAVGAEVAPTSNGSNYRAEALAGYNTVDQFKFVSGDSVADSGNGGSTAPSDTQLYTVSYIVNVAGSQVAGTYTTTLTYICTPTF